LPEYSYNSVVDKNFNQTAGQSIIGRGNIQLESHETSTLQGQSHFCGVNLITDPIANEGTEIGQKPVLINRTLYRTASNYTAKTNHTWCAYERTMVLRHGTVSVTA